MRKEPVHKRPYMPLSVKLKAAILQLGLDPDDVEYDHHPALALRTWNDNKGDWIPSANNPIYITILSKAAHARKTNGPPATAYGSDKGNIGKARRLSKGGRKRRGAAIPSRPFANRKKGPLK